MENTTEQKLIEKLELLKEIELKCYEHQVLLNQLKKAEDEIRHPELYEPNELPQSLKFDPFQYPIGHLSEGIQAGIIVYIVFFAASLFGVPFFRQMSFMMLLLYSLVIGIILPFLYSFWLILRYKLSYFRKTRSIRKYNRDVQSVNRAKLETGKIKGDIFLLFIEGEQERYNALEILKNQFHDKYLIKPAYRNLGAVTAFIDYLSSGKCSSLDCEDGCYAQFDMDLKSGRIINIFDLASLSPDHLLPAQQKAISEISTIYNKIEDLMKLYQELIEQFEEGLSIQEIFTKSPLAEYDQLEESFYQKYLALSQQ
jgi:hypothetical protein